MSSGGSGFLDASELSAIYPTPPSFEQHFSNPSSATSTSAVYHPLPGVFAGSPVGVGGDLMKPSSQQLALPTYSEEDTLRQRQGVLLQTSRSIFDQEAACFSRVHPTTALWNHPPCLANRFLCCIICAGMGIHASAFGPNMPLLQV